MSDRKQRFKLIEGEIKSYETNTEPGFGNSGNRPVAVVTGAGRGIGRALTEELRRQDYLVIAVVRSLSAVRELFSLDSENILPVRCDVTEPSTETVLREFIESQTGRVDLLINNAGHGASGFGIEGLDLGELDRVLAVHCYGPIRCVRACLPFLRKSEGTIVNISSRFGSLEWVASDTVPNDQSTYTYRIGKAALNMLSTCLTSELRSEGIRVLTVDPGKVKTRFGPIDADTEPADSARAILGLLSDSNETGLFLHVSGERVPW